MVRLLILSLSVAGSAFGALCGSDDLRVSFNDFKVACSAKRGSGMEEKINALQSGVAQLAALVNDQTPIPALALWQGLPVTCAGYPSRLSEQYDEASRRYNLALPSPDSGEYRTCFEGLGAERNAQTDSIFSKCVDSIREEKLQIAADFCGKSQSPSRLETLSQLEDSVVESFKGVLGALNEACNGDKTRVREAGLRVANQLASVLSSTEPYAESAGMGVAMSAVVLSASLDQLFDPAVTAHTAEQDGECLLVVTVERDLGCKKLPGSLAPARTISSASKANSVDAVLNAMQRVEDRAKPDEQNPHPNGLEFPALSSHPMLNEIVGAMDMRVLSNDRRALPMADYLRQISQDLQFAAGAWTKTGASESRVREYLGASRKHLVTPMLQAIRQMDPEQSRGIGRLGAGVESFVTEFQNYQRALAAGVQQAIEEKRTALLRSVANDAPDGISLLLRQALDRHQQLVLRSESLRKVRNYDFSRELNASVWEAATRQPDSLMAQTYPMLRDAYAEPLKKAAAQTKARMSEALRPLERNSKSLSKEQMAQVYEDAVQPMLNQCISLANAYVFGADTHSLSRSGVEEYQQICSPFLCADILGEFNFNDGAIPVREKQCQLFEDQKTLSKKTFTRFLSSETPGKLCTNKPEPSTLQRVQRFLRGNSAPTQDSNTKRR